MLIIPDVLKRFFEQIEKEEISQFIISPVKVADIKLLPFPGNILSIGDVCPCKFFMFFLVVISNNFIFFSFEIANILCYLNNTIYHI